MELESLTIFNELSNNLHNKQSELNSEKDKYTRQLIFFTDELDRAKTINDDKLISKADKAISVVTDKLEEINNSLEQLNLIPYAECVYQEAKEKILELKTECEKQWDKIIESRITFLKEIKKLGELRKECRDICHQTGEAGRVLRRNPLPTPGVSGQHQLIITLDHINDLIISNL
jgi:hypothetical protein